MTRVQSQINILLLLFSSSSYYFYTQQILKLAITKNGIAYILMSYVQCWLLCSRAFLSIQSKLNYPRVALLYAFPDYKYKLCSTFMR